MAMTIDVEHLGGTPAVSVVALDGELDASNYERVIEMVRAPTTRGARGLVLDLVEALVHGQLRPVRAPLGRPDHARRDAARSRRLAGARSTRWPHDHDAAGRERPARRAPGGDRPRARADGDAAAVRGRRRLARRRGRRPPGRLSDGLEPGACRSSSSASSRSPSGSSAPSSSWPASRPKAGRSRATTGPRGPSAATSSTSSRSLDPTGRATSASSIADVSGKGIAAALLMAFVRPVMRSALDRTGDPVTALERTNHILVDERRTGLFVTVVCGVLDLDTGVFTLRQRRPRDAAARAAGRARSRPMDPGRRPADRRLRPARPRAADRRDPARRAPRPVHRRHHRRPVTERRALRRCAAPGQHPGHMRRTGRSDLPRGHPVRPGVPGHRRPRGRPRVPGPPPAPRFKALTGPEDVSCHLRPMRPSRCD